MGRQSDARQRLLDAACELMHTRGYSVVGVAEICALADVRKGNFYYVFASKQALTLEAIDAHWARQRHDWVATLNAPGSALANLHQLVRDTALTQRAARESRGAVSGCVLANLALELSTQDAVVQTRLQEIFNEQIALIAASLHQAADQGSITRSGADRAVARGIVAQLEGMILFAKLGNDPDVLDDLWAQTLRLMGVPDMQAVA